MIRGDRLRQLRESFGYSREKLAQAINTTSVQIARYEYQQQDPGSEVVSRFAKFFNVSTDYLLGHTDNPMTTLKEGGLSEKELAAIAAWRSGERLKAIGIIVADQLPT